MNNWPTMRIFEALVIAGVTALASSYVTVKVLDERTSDLKEQIQTVRNTMTVLDTREQRHYDSMQESLRQIYSLLVRGRPGG